MTSKYRLQSIIVLVLTCYTLAEISNDIDIVSRENLPKPVSYFTFSPAEDVNENSDKSQGARFAYPTNLETAYGPNNVLAQGYYPWKFDLGGLVLGSVVGLGALLIIPKVIHLLAPELAGYGHYNSPYRRDAGFMPQGINEMITQVDRVLSENNVNSSECLQKAICSYIQSTVSKTEQARFSSENNGIDERSISSGIINFLIDGSKFKSAIENGIQDVSCSVLYPKCPFNQDSIALGVKQLMLNSNTFLDRDHTNSK